MAEEERPPIIVKGGSLRIQSGHDGEQGRPWEEFQGGYRQVQPQGVDVETFSVRYSGPHPSCRSVFGQTVRVRYKVGGHTAVAVIARNRDPVSGKQEPFVTPKRFRIDNTPPNPSLIDDAGSKIEEATVGIGQRCPIPDEVTVESLGSDKAPFRKGGKIGLIVAAALIGAAVWIWLQFQRDEEREQDRRTR